MKSNVIKSILILTMLCGGMLGLLLYNLAYIWLLMFFYDFIELNWLPAILLFLLGILIAIRVFRPLSIELNVTTSSSDINLIKLSKFFIGGILGCFAIISVVGPIVIGMYFFVFRFIYQ